MFCIAANVMRKQGKNHPSLTKADSKKKRPQRVADRYSLLILEGFLQCLT
jgi:hypothetical protein